MKTLKVLPISLLTAVLTTFAASTFGQEVIPITATLPIKTVGESCIELNLGTATYPNLIAAEGMAITADRASLLTCQSGQWKAGSGGGGLGVDQTWQDVRASRFFGVTYTNSTGRPVFISIGYSAADGGGGGRLFINGSLVARAGTASGGIDGQWTAVIPNGNTYSVTANVGFSVDYWQELRGD